MTKKIVAFLCIASLFWGCQTPTSDGIIMTVKGPIPVSAIKETLTHEHVLVDFIGADSTGEHRWNKAEVVKVVLPYLQQIKDYGCNTFFDCTPAYIGRDPEILKMLSDSSGMHLITNTGFYGAGDNKYIPDFAFSESADQLAQRWIKEWEEGINGTPIKPGFIKIGVNRDSLSEMHSKLITAAARAHLKTGLTIAGHTGLFTPAFQQLDILEAEGVAGDAFIWVHAQAEKDYNKHLEAAKKGAWVSLDGLNDENANTYLEMISNLKDNGLLHKVLLSHDAGWYSPGEKNGGSFRDYSALFEKLLPLLKEKGFKEEEIRQLLIVNPGKAYEIKVRDYLR